MPQVRKLDPSEVQTIENKGIGLRKQTEKLYDSILADYEVGDYGEAVLDEGENRLTVRNRMKAAATRRGLGINFRRTSGDLIRFQIVEQGNGTENNNGSSGNGISGESASTLSLRKVPLRQSPQKLLLHQPSAKVGDRRRRRPHNFLAADAFTSRSFGAALLRTSIREH